MGLARGLGFNMSIFTDLQTLYVSLILLVIDVQEHSYLGNLNLVISGGLDPSVLLYIKLNERLILSVFLNQKQTFIIYYKF